MKIISIKDNQKNLKYILCKKLANKIFHITSPIGYIGILRDKAIYPSNHKNIKNHIWGFSKYGKYFTNKSCISVVDFYNNKNRKLLLKAIVEYKFYDVHTVANGSVAYYFVLKTNSYNIVISWDNIKNDWRKNSGQHIVPNLESGIKDKILLSDIDYIIRVETVGKYFDHTENLIKSLRKR